MKSLSLKDTLASSEREYEEIIRYVRMMARPLSVIAPNVGSIFIEGHLKRLVDGELSGTGVAIPLGKHSLEGLKNLFSNATSMGTTDDRLIAIAVMTNATLSRSHLIKRPGLNLGFDQMLDPECYTSLLVDVEQALISARNYMNGDPQFKQLDGPVEIQVKVTSTYDDDMLAIVTWEKDEPVRFMANHALHGSLYKDLSNLAEEMLYQWANLTKEQQKSHPWPFGTNQEGRLFDFRDYLVSNYPNIEMFGVDKFEEIVKNDPKILSIRVDRGWPAEDAIKKRDHRNE